MKVGLCVNTGGMRHRGDGVLSEATHYFDELNKLGHNVIKLNPWEPVDVASLDVVHFFQGGYPKYLIEKDPRIKHLVFSPIIDSNQSFSAYRLAAWIGSRSDRIRTSQGCVREQAAGSDLIVCRSTHERDRVVRGLGIPIKKTVVILDGATLPPDGDLPSPLEARRKYDLPEKIVLHVSSYTQSRKNAVRLAQAVGPIGLPLVFAGTASPGLEYNRLAALATRFPNIKLLGFQDSSTLGSLYALSHVFCLPSIHEGAGLVGLDAACHGANIVVTKNGGPPDYYLNMAEYVDPYSVESIRSAVLSAWNRPRNLELAKYVATHLTWERAARQLVKAYESVLIGEAP